MLRLQSRLSIFLSLVLSLTLVSCGGGSSGNSSGNGNSGGNLSTAGQAQGVYEGTTSTGFAFDAMVLPDDTFYAVYGTLSGNVLYICGMATGQGASSSGNYTATETDFYYCGGQFAVYNGNVTATYTTVSMNGSITENGNSETFSASVPPSSQFNFTNAASLSAISGTWNGSLTDGESATVTIDSAGNMSGASSGGCSFSGKITPDTTNRNFFDVTVTLGLSPCMAPNQTAAGIGVDYLLSDGVTTQLIAGVSSGNSFGIVFAAQRLPTSSSSGGFSKSNLNGTYVFSVSGTDSGGSAYALVGSFTANGSGGISGGTLDVNDASFAPVPNSSISGSGSSYSVGVDGRGQAKLSTSTPFGTIVLDFVLQDSTHGLVTEFDNNASGTGTLDLQASSITPNGSYAFILSGAYGSSGNLASLITVGNFTLGASGVISSGLEDFNSSVVAYPNETVSGTIVVGPSSTPATQLVATPSGGAAQYTITYDVYAIDASHLKFIEMDTNGTLSGDAFAQSSTSMPSNTTLAFTVLGGTSTTVVASGGFMVMDANGNVLNTSTADVNNTGTFSPAPVQFSATTTAGGTGRYTLDLSGFAAGTQYAAYPSSGGLLLLEIDNSGMMAGNALQQSSTDSLATSQGYALNLSGTNLGLTTNQPVEVDDIAEFATSSSGTNLTGVTDENYAPGAVPSYALALNGNYSAPDSNGRGQLAANAGNSSNGTINGGFSLTYYTVDGTSFPFIESDNGQVTVGVFLKQSSSASSSSATRSHMFVLPTLVRPRYARRRYIHLRS